MNAKISFTMVLLGCLLAFSYQSNARDTGNLMSSQERTEKMSLKMKEVLLLNDMQYPKVCDINSKYGKKDQDILNNSAKRKSKLKAIRANQKGKDKELKKVLTKDQFKKYLRLKEEFLDDVRINF
jgi:hypothetical protein